MFLMFAVYMYCGYPLEPPYCVHRIYVMGTNKKDITVVPLYSR